MTASYNNRQTSEMEHVFGKTKYNHVYPILNVVFKTFSLQSKDQKAIAHILNCTGHCGKHVLSTISGEQVANRYEGHG